MNSGLAKRYSQLRGTLAECSLANTKCLLQQRQLSGTLANLMFITAKTTEWHTYQFNVYHSKDS